LSKEVEEIITELMRTQPEVVIRTALQENHQLVLSEVMDYAADGPLKKAAIKMALRVWLANTHKP